MASEPNPALAGVHSWWGTLSGAGVGAALGTAVFPVVGTLLGTVIGAGVGFVARDLPTMTNNTKQDAPK